MLTMIKEMLKEKYLKSENLLDLIKEDFPMIVKEKTTKNSLEGIYIASLNNIFFNSVFVFISKENTCLLFSSEKGDIFISNSYIDPYILSCFEELSLSNSKLSFNYMNSKVKSLPLSIDDISLQKYIMNKRNDYEYHFFKEKEENHLTSYCSKLNYSKKRRFLIRKTTQKRVSNLLFNQCSSKPFLTEALNIKLFNKIIYSILKDIFKPFKDLDDSNYRTINEKWLNERIQVKRILSLILNRNEIIANYIVPYFISSVKFRKNDFDDFLIYFDKYFTPRIISEISNLKIEEKNKTLFSLDILNSIIIKYGVGKISFFDKELPLNFISDLKKLDDEVLKFLEKNKKKNNQVDLLFLDDVPF